MYSYDKRARDAPVLASAKKHLNMPRKPRVKICCIGSVEEAWTAINHGASAIGLVSEMPSGPGVIPEELIANIASFVPPSISSFLLTSKRETDAIIAQQRRTRANTIQICDRLESGSYQDLRRALPGIALVQVIHVTGPEALEEAKSIETYVNGILLDSGNPALAVKELGGTGRTHDWNLSRTIRESVNVPIFLAGGLTPENIVSAIHQVEPFGVDVCSGVRTLGRLDTVKLSNFFHNISTA
jgi:phosphoribosylanthranilate isomerase